MPAKLDKEARQLIRSLVLEHIEYLGIGTRGNVLCSVDQALSKYNRLVTPGKAKRKCCNCGQYSTRGAYSDGRKRWYCPACAENRTKFYQGER